MPGHGFGDYYGRGQGGIMLPIQPRAENPNLRDIKRLEEILRQGQLPTELILVDRDDPHPIKIKIMFFQSGANVPIMYLRVREETYTIVNEHDINSIELRKERCPGRDTVYPPLLKDTYVGSSLQNIFRAYKKICEIPKPNLLVSESVLFDVYGSDACVRDL